MGKWRGPIFGGRQSERGVTQYFSLSKNAQRERERENKEALKISSSVSLLPVCQVIRSFLALVDAFEVFAAALLSRLMTWSGEKTSESERDWRHGPENENAFSLAHFWCFWSFFLHSLSDSEACLIGAQNSLHAAEKWSGAKREKGTGPLFISPRWIASSSCEAIERPLCTKYFLFLCSRHTSDLKPQSQSITTLRNTNKCPELSFCPHFEQVS